MFRTVFFLSFDAMRPFCYTRLASFIPQFAAQKRAARTGGLTMLRSTDDRDLARTFSRIETWEEFLKRWEAIDTEQEAVGLLHAGTSLLSGSSDHRKSHSSAELARRTRFYLQWSEHTNDTIATIAQQLVVKKWLEDAGHRVNRMELTELHHELLTFLGTRRPALTKPPYPRFIATYLTKVFEPWNLSPKLPDEKGKLALALRPLGEVLVCALCAWGLAPLLAHGGGDFPEKIALLERYFKGNQLDAEHTLMDICNYGPPPADFSAEITGEDALTRAGHALLKLRYWHAWSSEKRAEIQEQHAKRFPK